MKYRTEWIVALLLALGLVFAAAQWNLNRPGNAAPGIHRVVGLTGVITTVDIDADMLVWENTAFGGSSETAYHHVTVKGIYRDNYWGDDTWDMEELAVEGIAITIPGYVEPGKLTGQMGGYLFLGYNSYDNGKPYIQTVGHLHITPDGSKFAITFAKGELGAKEDRFRVASCPAQNRDEAVQTLKTVLQETNHVWRHAIWE